MPPKCPPGQHPEVTLQQRYIPATRDEPAETDTRYICTECGAILDPSDLSGDEIIHEE